MGSKLKMSLDPTKRKETEKTKMVTPRSVAVKEKEKKKKKKNQRIRINNDAIPREKNHRKKILKNMETVKIVERVFK